MPMSQKACVRSAWRALKLYSRTGAAGGALSASKPSIPECEAPAHGVSSPSGFQP